MVKIYNVHTVEENLAELFIILPLIQGIIIKLSRNHSVADPILWGMLNSLLNNSDTFKVALEMKGKTVFVSIRSQRPPRK